MDNNQVYDASLDAEMENRSKTEQIKDETGKIMSYKFTIYVHDKPTIEGQFTRDEMEKIYRLYSSEGSALTQRSVSREFPNYTFQEFKKILKAFNITKSGSAPLAPHTILERTTDELVALTIQNKENDYLRKLEQDRNRLTENKLKEAIKENYELKQIVNSGKHFISDIDFTPVKFQISTNPEFKNTLLVYLSDMHIGAFVSDESVYDNTYNEEEVNRRLTKVFERIARFNNLDHIIILNLGDAIDGYNASTTRPSSSHVLPQNMTNKQQGKVLIKCMVNFFNNIRVSVPCNKISFYSVGHSNHGGDFEHSIMTALSVLLENIGVETYVATKSIDYFKVGDKTIIYGHGKDNLDQFKNFPLTLNEKTELYINEYILRNKLSGEILMVKGDLHQSATTYGKQFKYKSVSSLFGSSNWVCANFGFTPWGCDYTLIDEFGESMDGLIKE